MDDRRDPPDGGSATTTLAYVVGVGGAVVGAFFAVVGLATAVLKLVGLLACFGAAAVMVQAARDRDRGKLTNAMLAWLMVGGVLMLSFVVLLADEAGRQRPTGQGAANVASPGSGGGGPTVPPTDSTSPEATAGGATTTSPPAKAEETWLVDLQPVEAALNQVWATNPVQVKGTEYGKAFSARNLWCDSVQLDFVLGGDYRRFQAMVGLADGSPETDPLTFYVLTDGKRAKAIADVGIADPQKVDLSVEGVSRLAIGIEPPSGSLDSCHGPDRVGVWIDPRLTR